MATKKFRRSYSDLALLGHILEAASEPLDVRKMWKTDLIGIARQYSGKRVSRSEYERVLSLSISEILAAHDEYLSTYLAKDTLFRKSADKKIKDDLANDKDF